MEFNERIIHEASPDCKAKGLSFSTTVTINPYGKGIEIRDRFDDKSTKHHHTEFIHLTEKKLKDIIAFVRENGWDV